MMGRIDDRMLQQLVDGELDEQSYRETLLALADDPDGWRRCALAFLEDQSLRRQLAWPPRAEVQAAVAPAQPARPHTLALWLAIAASFILAFVGGYELNRWRTQRSADRLAAGILLPSFRGNSNPSGGNQLAAPRTKDDRLGSWHLVVDGPDGAGGQSIELPIYLLDENSSQWLVDDRSSFPPQMFDALEKTGQEVHRSKFLAPVDLEDGRRMVIPVEQVEITPVSQAY